MRDDRRSLELDRRDVLGLAAGAMVAAGSSALGALLAACSGGGEESAAPSGGPSTSAPASGSGPAAASAEAAAPAGTSPGSETQGAGAAAGEAKLVTAYPENEALVSSLQYAHQSPKADQHCSNCFFFTAVGDERGRCQLFARGLVEAGGWCSSWQARPA